MEELKDRIRFSGCLYALFGENVDNVFRMASERKGHYVILFDKSRNGTRVMELMYSLCQFDRCEIECEGGLIRRVTVGVVGSVIEILDIGDDWYRFVGVYEVVMVYGYDGNEWLRSIVCREFDDGVRVNGIWLLCDMKGVEYGEVKAFRDRLYGRVCDDGQ